MIQPTSSAKGGLSWLGWSALVIILDQLTKWLAVKNLTYQLPVEVFSGLNWTLLHNFGAAFSFLSNAGGWQRWFFLIVGVIITIVLVVWLKRSPKSDWRTCLPLSLIIGGAIGNLIDRFYLGYVVDFIDVWHWPAFNLADSAISVGAVLLILFGFSQGKAEE